MVRGLMRSGPRTVVAVAVLGLLLVLFGPWAALDAAAGAASHSSSGSRASGALRSWMKLHDVVFLSLQTDLRSLSTVDANGSTTAITAACQQLEADLATITHLPPIPDTAPERHWHQALSDLARGAADCVQGIVGSNETVERRAAPLFRSGVSQVNDVLAALKSAER